MQKGRNLTSCFRKLPGARPPPARTPLRFGRSSQPRREPAPCPVPLPAPSPIQPGVSFCRDFEAGGTLRVGAVALAAGPSPGHGTDPGFALLFQVAAAHVPQPEPEPASAAPATVLPLARQHLVARFPGALLPQGLFPYLGGKRNQKTERGPKPASERLPARAARSGRGWQPEWALQNSGGPAGVRQCQGRLPAPLSAAPQQSSAAAR